MIKYRIVKEEKRGHYSFYYVQCKHLLFWWTCDTDGVPWFNNAEFNTRFYPTLEDAKNAVARFRYSGPSSKTKKEVVWKSK